MRSGKAERSASCSLFPGMNAVATMRCPLVSPATSTGSYPAIHKVSKTSWVASTVDWVTATLPLATLERQDQARACAGFQFDLPQLHGMPVKPGLHRDIDGFGIRR